MSRTHPGQWYSGIMGAVLAIALVMFAGAWAPSYAQGFTSAFSSFGPLASLETVVGPIFPESGLASSFRSEFGSGLTFGTLKGAKLVGSILGERDLRTVSYLNESPLRLDLYATLRLWRLGFRGAYSNFENRSDRFNFATVDFSGVRIGGDFDVIQHRWITWGAAVDVYFFGPEFHGGMVDAVLGTVRVDVRGKRPITIGTYFRYVPPDIIGFPLHFESYFRIPFQGSRLTTIGSALVFRPQIYQFDLSCKLLYQRTYLKFQNDPKSQDFVPYQDWELDMEWNMFGVEAAIYF